MDAKPLDLVVIRKLYDMLDSDQEDGNAARTKLRLLLGRHGKRIRDLPEMLAKGGSPPVGGDPKTITDLQLKVLSLQTKLASIYGDLQHAQTMREYAERSHALSESLREQAEERGRKKERERIKQQQWAKEVAARDRRLAEMKRANAAQEALAAKERRALIKRYCSVAAVLAPCEREKLLKASVSEWSKSYTKDHPEWTTSVCRCVNLGDILGRKKPLTHVMEAISQAFPLPETLDGAIGEQAYWDRRVRETALVRPGWVFAAGDLTIQIRQHVLRSLIDTMPARSVRDVIARLQSGDIMSEKLQATLLADLKALSAGATETIVSHEEFRAVRLKREAPMSRVKPKRQPPGQQTFGF
jgi:hypothetical protein